MGECSVCLNPVRCTRLTKSLPCGHMFHGTCIDKWIESGGDTCPMCRKSITPQYKVTITIENTRTNQTSTFTNDTEAIVNTLLERLGLDRETFYSTELSFNAENLQELDDIITDIGFPRGINVNALVLNTE